MDKTLLTTGFAWGNWWTRPSFKDPRLSRRNSWTRLSFLASRFARGYWWTRLFYTLALLEGIGGPDFRIFTILVGEELTIEVMPFNGDFSKFNHMAPKRHFLDTIFFIIFFYFLWPKGFGISLILYGLDDVWDLTPNMSKRAFYGSNYLKIFFSKNLGRENNFELFCVFLRRLYRFQS